MSYDLKVLKYSLLEDLYSQRDLYAKYAFGYYGIPVSRHMFNLTNESGARLATYDSEPSAIRAAEDMAKSNPGRAFYVTKSVTKSYVAPAPSITTRL